MFLSTEDWRNKMKKGVLERNFKKIKNQFTQIQEIVKHTKSNALWEHESAVRKKLKELKEFKGENFKDYKRVYENYSQLLEYISIRLVEDYNKKNNTNFDFENILKNKGESYLKSGIISVLITEHIPEIISSEFERVFPSNPKDEYAESRKFKRKFYLHLGETNTGKTYNAMMKLREATKGIYLSPLRILALENFERLNREGVKCNLATGEEEINIEDASHICCTIEKLDLSDEYEVGIIDEIQMIDNDQRGAAWTRALLGLKSKEIHICGATNAKELIVKILDDCTDEYEIKEYKRDVPLVIEDKSFAYQDTYEGDALVTFSKKKVLELAYHYSNLGVKASLIYGDLPPEVRKKQYNQFINKEIREHKITNIFNFTRSIIETMLEAQDDVHIEEMDYLRTVKINSLDIKTTDFNICNEKIIDLYESGVTCAKEFLNSFESNYKKHELLRKSFYKS